MFVCIITTILSCVVVGRHSPAQGTARLGSLVVARTTSGGCLEEVDYIPPGTQLKASYVQDSALPHSPSCNSVLTSTLFSVHKDIFHCYYILFLLFSLVCLMNIFFFGSGHTTDKSVCLIQGRP